MKNDELNIWRSINENNFIEKIKNEINLLKYYDEEYNTLNPISNSEFENVNRSILIINNCIQKVKNCNWKIENVLLAKMENEAQELFAKIKTKKEMSD